MRLTKAGAGLLAAALLLTGCGRGAENTAPEAAKEVKDGAATGTIKVWAMGGEGEKLPQLAKTYEAANPGVKIEVLSLPWDGAHDKIAAAVAARNTPDISLIGTTWMAEFAKTGALDPVPALIDRASFFPGAMEAVTVNSTAYGVPWYVDTRALFYRKDLAEKAGIKDAPKTWDDLKKLAKAYQDKAGAKWGMYLPPTKPGSGQFVVPWTWQQGGEVVKDGAYTMDTPEMVKSLAFYKSFFTEKLAPTSLQAGDAERWFIDGTLGMQITGPWMVKKFEELGGPGFADKFGIVPLPGNGKQTSFVGGGDLAVFKESKNRDAAWKFVHWLTQAETQLSWYDIQKDLPSVQAAWQDQKMSADAKVAAFGEQLKDTKAMPATETWEQVQKMIEEEVEKLVHADAEPADVAKTIQEKAAQIGTGA
ncbi:extracellular solute-binding protein [Nonomuraea sp. NBC_01738]|uniref:extracellular solute-binding protein n=1 Tax=Nonomuraea sp. NBC_01738 TaxID=2976003 RepID=UPI002E13D9A4|nr:extracellular solute-binding protein [Nonomuraea sp. NBC_01738]